MFEHAFISIVCPKLKQNKKGQIIRDNSCEKGL